MQPTEHAVVVQPGHEHGRSPIQSLKRRDMEVIAVQVRNVKVIERG